MYEALKNPRIRLLTTPIVIILCLTLIVPVLSGCSSTAASNTYIELMSLVPADFAVRDSGYVSFVLIDHSSYYEDYGITFSTPEEFIDLFGTTPLINYLAYGDFITGYTRYLLTSPIRKEYVGYDITYVDAEIHIREHPTIGIAAIGRFDPQATRDALSHQDEWPSWAVTAYTSEDYRGVTIHSWGSGLETHMSTTLCPPHIDQLGRARPLAVTDKYLFNANSAEDIKLSIDTSQGQHSSLADLPEYAAIANGLTDLNVYAAMVCEEAIANLFLSSLEYEHNPQSEAEVEMLINSMGIPLKNFLIFGTGLGADEKGTYTAVVLYHENSDDALQNVSLLKQRIENVKSISSDELWSTIISDTDITTEGNTLLAKLYTSSQGFWLNLIYDWDNLLFHEE